MLLNVTVQIVWGQSFWGGHVALIGGALVYGALPRILRGEGPSRSVILGIGLALLANSRPYEGLVAALPAAAALASSSWSLLWGAGRCAPSMSRVFARVVMPLGVVLMGMALAMGYYNQRVTGSPLSLPYGVYEEAYAVAPVFLWGTPRPVPEYRHPSMRDAHAGWGMRMFQRQRDLTAPTLLAVKVLDAKRVATRLLAPVAWIGLLAIPWVMRRRNMGWVALWRSRETTSP